MRTDNELQELINNLRDLFVYRQGFTEYNRETQSYANIVLKRIAILTNTFDKMKKNEINNIRNELIINDAVTGKKIELIDTDRIDGRIKNLLSDNNMFSCSYDEIIYNKYRINEKYHPNGWYFNKSIHLISF